MASGWSDWRVIEERPGGWVLETRDYEGDDGIGGETRTRMTSDDESETCWKGNPHWMRRRGEPEPTHDPPAAGCESCGWLDEGEDVATSDLIWVPAEWGFPGGWVCMECY